MTLSLHENLKLSFFEAFQKRPHHAWIFKGPKGVGKLNFSKEIATKLLTEETPDENILTKIENQNHPNFLYVAPSEESALQTISIDQIRSIFQFLQQTSPDNNWRIVILDSLNALTQNSANGLLKILESPPSRTVFFLIHHDGGVILPTIISRCTQLSFVPSHAETLETLLPPTLSNHEKTLILAIARGCPYYLEDLLDQDILGLYTLFEKASTTLVEDNNYELAHKFSQTIGRDKLKRDVFLSFLEWWLSTAVKEVALNERIFFKISCSLASLLDIQQTISKIMKWDKTLDLDGSQLVLNVFFELKKLRPS